MKPATHFFGGRRVDWSRSCAILASTFSLGTATILFASAANFRNPSGFLSVIRVLSSDIHELVATGGLWPSWPSDPPAGVAVLNAPRRTPSMSNNAQRPVFTAPARFSESPTFVASVRRDSPNHRVAVGSVDDGSGAAGAVHGALEAEARLQEGCWESRSLVGSV